jgi:carboxypeptidase Q
MFRRQFAALILLLALAAPYATLAQQPQGPPAPQLDPNDPIAKIREEGLNHSHVMETLSYLSDVIGPRLTASPNMKRANEWTRDMLTKWGLQDAHL